MSNQKKFEQREKACNERIEKFLKYQANALHPIILELLAFIPEFTGLIIQKIFMKIINFLSMGNTPKEILDGIFQMLLLMLSKSEGKPELEPYKTLFSDKEFLTGLFMHTGIDEKGEFDHQVIDIIYKYLIMKGPQKLIEFLLESKESVYSLMNALADHDVHDIDASLLFKQIFVCNPKVTQSLVEEVKPLIRKFPAHLVVDLMITNAELKNTMTEEEFGQWLLEQETFTLSDVNQVFQFYKNLWPDLLSMKIILKTDPPKKIAFVKWIHDMPVQDFVLPEQMTKDTFNQIMSPKYQFEILEDDILKQKFNTRDYYLFSRLFVLSHSNPVYAKPEAVKFLYELMHEADEYVAAGALQVLVIWISKFNFKTESSIIYQIAEEIDSNRTESIKALYRICLHFLAMQHKVGEMILRTEPMLRYSKSGYAKVTRATWEFKNFEQHLKNVPSFEEFDENKMLQVLDCITEYFGIQVEEEEDIDDNE